MIPQESSVFCTSRSTTRQAGGWHVLSQQSVTYTSLIHPSIVGSTCNSILRNITTCGMFTGSSKQSTKHQLIIRVISTYDWVKMQPYFLIASLVATDCADVTAAVTAAVTAVSCSCLLLLIVKNNIIYVLLYVCRRSMSDDDVICARWSGGKSSTASKTSKGELQTCTLLKLVVPRPVRDYLWKYLSVWTKYIYTRHSDFGSLIRTSSGSKPKELETNSSENRLKINNKEQRKNRERRIIQHTCRRSAEPTTPRSLVAQFQKN